MDFFLFLLVNAALFLRPQDLMPSLSAVPVYNTLIVINLVIAVPAIVARLRGGMKRTPAIFCVVGILAALMLSLVARNDLDGAWFWGQEFAKVAAYFLLCISLLTTTNRFFIYLTSIVVLTVVLTALAVANFHGQLELPAIKHARETIYDKATGDQSEIVRLAAFGVFADPNDLSMIIVLSILICLGGMFYRDFKLARYAIAGPLLFLFYSLALTQSRGGLLALISGMAVFLANRFGSVRSTLAIAVLVPALLVGFGGRQANISGAISAGTGGQRTELWYTGLQMLKWSPIVGMGHGQFKIAEGRVAHSSYVQALAEWGFLGGTMFIGLFYLILYSVWRLKPVRQSITSPLLRNFQPYLLGALAAYAAAMLTLTRCDVVPTYMVAGLGVSYERLARPSTPLKPIELNSWLIGRMALVTVGFIVLTHIYIRYIYRLF